MSPDPTVLAEAMHYSAQSRDVTTAETITAGKFLQSETIAAKKFLALMVSKNCTVLRVNVNFSTVGTRASCQRWVGVSMATFFFIGIHPISLSTDNVVAVIYHCIVFEVGVPEFVPKCLAALSLVVLS